MGPNRAVEWAAAWVASMAGDSVARTNDVGFFRAICPPNSSDSLLPLSAALWSLMSSDRRQFLQRLAVGAAAVSSVPSLLHAAPRLGEPNPDPIDTLAAEFDDATLTAADPEWDTSWTKKVTGKHRALFDVPGVSGGAGVFRAGLWAKQYADVFKMPASELSAVIVLRHEGIILAMNQAFWDEYKVGKRNKVRDGDDKKTTKNPVLAPPTEAGKPEPAFNAYMLEQQIARGVVVLACNLAFGGCVRAVMKQDKTPQPEARAKAISMLVPGIILQPSGIFADVLAQQSGCAFVAAS